MEYYNKYFEGVFWLPEREDRKIISTLFIDKNGTATITSLESLEINEDMFNRVWNNFNLVLGYINCNEKSKTYSIKLYDVYKIHQSSGALTKFKYKSINPLRGSINFHSVPLYSNIIEFIVKSLLSKPFL